MSASALLYDASSAVMRLDKLLSPSALARCSVVIAELALLALLSASSATRLALLAAVFAVVKLAFKLLICSLNARSFVVKLWLSVLILDVLPFAVL